MVYIGTKKVTAYYNGKQIFMPLYGVSEKAEIEVPETQTESNDDSEGETE
jgi:hypothetical protein